MISIKRISPLFLAYLLFLFQPAYGATRLSIPEVIQNFWGQTLKEISVECPGGKIYDGDAKTKTVSTYLIKAYFSDLNVNATVTFQFPPLSNLSTSKHRKFVKSINIYNENYGKLEEILDKIKLIIKEIIPQGGPGMEEGINVGYFIPLDKNILSAIDIHWSISGKGENQLLNLTIQKLELNR